MKKAIITGITGQDGSYLTEILLDKGYSVHGLIRRSSNFNTQRIDHLIENENLKLYHGDLTDSLSIHSLIDEVRPDEIYNLGAQSHVRISFDVPYHTIATIVEGTLNLLESIRKIDPTIKYYQASSSEMFGKVQETPQSETTPFYPRSPYGIAKVAAYWLTKNYREAYNIFACNGILFNHESSRRGKTFVTQKIVDGAIRIWDDIQNRREPKKLQLGNLDAKRDWGHALEYMQAAWKMLQHSIPDDYVIATNETHTVQEFLEETFNFFELDYKDHIEINKKYIRPTEVDVLIGDYSKAKKILKWEPTIKFKELVEIMIKESLIRLKLKRPV